jgi:hypothetical protein
MNQLSNINVFVAKRDSEESVVIKGVVPSSLKLQFKVLCTKQELKMSEVIEDLIEGWIQADGESVPEFTPNLSEEDFVEVKGYVPESIKIRFKILCTQKRVSIRSVLYHLINEWVHSGGSAK